MGKRVDLQQLLETLTPNVYFQPPEDVTMVALEYPCIVYKRLSTGTGTRFADDRPYSRIKCYQVTIIDEDPDSDIPDKVADLPMCLFNAHFTSDNLNHDVYTLYY